MLYLAIAELMSADVLVDRDSCLKAKVHLENLKKALPVSKKRDDAKIADLLKEAEQIIEQELKIC